MPCRSLVWIEGARVLYSYLLYQLTFLVIQLQLQHIATHCMLVIMFISALQLASCVERSLISYEAMAIQLQREPANLSTYKDLDIHVEYIVHSTTGQLYTFIIYIATQRQKYLPSYVCSCLVTIITDPLTKSMSNQLASHHQFVSQIIQLQLAIQSFNAWFIKSIESAIANQGLL